MHTSKVAPFHGKGVTRVLLEMAHLLVQWRILDALTFMQHGLLMRLLGHLLRSVYLTCIFVKNQDGSLQRWDGICFKRRLRVLGSLL